MQKLQIITIKMSFIQLAENSLCVNFKLVEKLKLMIPSRSMFILQM